MAVDVASLKGLSADSRAVKRGYLFAALPGSKLDGRDYIPIAIEHGASVVLAPEGTALPEGAGDVQLVTDTNPRKAFAKLAAEFYGRQPEHIVAVTGTNGKTSVVTFAEQLLLAAGHKATSLGTLKGNMTTPDPVALHAQLADLEAVGVTHLAIEASSHGLDQYRLDGLVIEAAGFTNLSRDHLDYHGDMEGYLAAKARLFEEVLPESGAAVLNADAEEFAALEDICKARGVRVLSYGRKGIDLKILDLKPASHGQALKLEVLGQNYELTLPLVGEFQAMNALCALGLVIAQDEKNVVKHIEALGHIQGAPGRLQLVGGHPQGAAVYVDYAHTPDALENVLKALRLHTEGKLFCVFGCGGDRDKGKRPVMGEITGRLSDEAIVTDDNPRGEDPTTIRAQILEAAPGALEIGDRRSAIHQTIEKLESGDVLIIAGKGHEQGQIFSDRTEPFDDAEVAAEVIQKLIQSKT